MYTNRNSKKDFVINGFNTLGSGPCNASFAVAFFTDAEPIKEMIKKGSRVRLVVRLGHPTSPTALKEVMKLDGCLVRYVSDRSFHPKFYIFGEVGAIVGSANLTNAALWTNQEVSLKVEPDDERFDELKILFEEYWTQAAVLTAEVLSEYDAVISAYEKSVYSKMIEIQSKLEEKVGKVQIDNIVREKKKKTKIEVYVDDYRKGYQESVEAFNKLRKIYEQTGVRKTTEKELPLRLEIDSFISYLRNEYATGDSYKDAPAKTLTDIESSLLPLIEEWKDAEYKWLHEYIVPKSYPKIHGVFSSPKSIMNCSDDELYDAITCLHAFDSQYRFSKGGAKNQKANFFKDNDIDGVREILEYLVFGADDVVVRMANCSFNPSYSITKFKRSCVQELIGWVSKEELPVMNGRTTKVLRYLGFNVRQISE